MHLPVYIADMGDYAIVVEFHRDAWNVMAHIILYRAESVASALDWAQEHNYKVVDYSVIVRVMA